jgi:hypothetical protein
MYVVSFYIFESQLLTHDFGVFVAPLVCILCCSISSSSNLPLNATERCEMLDHYIDQCASRWVYYIMHDAALCCRMPDYCMVCIMSCTILPDAALPLPYAALPLVDRVTLADTYVYAPST